MFVDAIKTLFFFTVWWMNESESRNTERFPRSSRKRLAHPRNALDAISMATLEKRIDTLVANFWLNEPRAALFTWSTWSLDLFFWLQLKHGLWLAARGRNDVTSPPFDQIKRDGVHFPFAFLTELQCRHLTIVARILSLKINSKKKTQEPPCLPDRLEAWTFFSGSNWNTASDWLPVVGMTSHLRHSTKSIQSKMAQSIAHQNPMTTLFNAVSLGKPVPLEKKTR